MKKELVNTQEAGSASRNSKTVLVADTPGRKHTTPLLVEHEDGCQQCRNAKGWLDLCKDGYRLVNPKAFPDFAGGHELPRRVWIDFRDEPTSRYWRVYTAPNVFAFTGYTRDDAVNSHAALIAALEPFTTCIRVGSLEKRDCAAMRSDPEWEGLTCNGCIARAALFLARGEK